MFYYCKTVRIKLSMPKCDLTNLGIGRRCNISISSIMDRLSLPCLACRIAGIACGLALVALDNQRGGILRYRILLGD